MTNQARASQRIFSFVIDYAIIMAVGIGLSYLLNFIIAKITDVNIINNANYYYKLLINQYEKVFVEQNVADEEIEKMLSVTMEYIKAYGLELLIKGGMCMITICAYSLPLSFKWKWQTVGRRAMMCRVIRVDGSEMTAKNILLRELLGMFLLFCFFGFRAFAIISLILIACGKRSLLDCISGTKCVTLRPDEILESHQYHQETMDRFKRSDDDYIDAKFKDIDDDYINPNKNNETKEDSNSYGSYYGEDYLNKEKKDEKSDDDSDDEYRII